MENIQTNENKPIVKTKQTGFEILRIIAMILICCVHLMNAGGMIIHSGGGPALTFQRLLYAFFLISVNVFVLITGYFMVTSKIKVKKIVILWLEVLFYSVLTYLVTSLFFKHNFAWDAFAYSFFPILNNRYWFFTAYFLLYISIPFLNKIMQNSTKREGAALVIIIFILAYVSTRFSIKQVSLFTDGYSYIWFLLLYLLGAYLRQYPPQINKLNAFIIYISCTLAVFGFTAISNNSFLTKLVYNSLDYDSPLVLLASMAAIILFKDITIKNTFVHKTICYISSCTFGVYLYHNSVFMSTLFFTILQIQRHYGSPYSAFWVLVYGIIIFIGGVLIDSIRQGSFFVTKKIYQKIKKNKKQTETPQNPEPIIEQK